MFKISQFLFGKRLKHFCPDIKSYLLFLLWILSFRSVWLQNMFLTTRFSLLSFKYSGISSDTLKLTNIFLVSLVQWIRLLELSLNFLSWVNSYCFSLCVFIPISAVTWRTTRSLSSREEPSKTSDFWRDCKFSFLNCYLTFCVQAVRKLDSVM